MRHDTLGVTEAQLFIVGLLIVTGLLGPEVWLGEFHGYSYRVIAAVGPTIGVFWQSAERYVLSSCRFRHSSAVPCPFLSVNMYPT